MRVETILNHIDKNILIALENGDFDSARQKIFSTSKRFKDRVPEVEIELDKILQIPDSRTKYTALYVLCSEQRILDLYQIELKKLDQSALKSFKMFLFKEKLRRGDKIYQCFTSKYKSYLNKK